MTSRPDPVRTAAVHAALGEELRRYFARRVQGPLVDDLVQDTFLRVHQGLPGLRDHDRLAPWVMRVARSVLVDHLRKRREDLHEDTDEQDVLTVPPDSPFPDPTAVVASWLPLYIEALAEPYREALRRTELLGHSQARLARDLGLSASGARSRVQRGRRLLREALEACCEIGWEGGEVVAVARRADPCACA
jgi:RNA polymerase sigma-70 factor (ECF subfamily)